AGLATVVHRYGSAPLIDVIEYGIAPVETVLFILMLVLAGAGGIYLAVLLAYACYELGKIWLGWRITLFAQAEDRAYVPFLNNAFYEVWGPLAASLQAAFADPALLLLVVMFITLFWSRMAVEWRMVRALGADLARRLGAG